MDWRLCPKSGKSIRAHVICALPGITMILRSLRRIVPGVTRLVLMPRRGEEKIQNKNEIETAAELIAGPYGRSFHGRGRPPRRNRESCFAGITLQSLQAGPASLLVPRAHLQLALD